MLQTPQNEGYKKFFTNKKMHEPIIAMKFAKQTAKLNRYSSNLEAVDIINDDFFSGPLHFGRTDFVKDDNYRYYDLDLESAYSTWLLNYARGNFNYKVGGSKEYFQGYDYFLQNDKKGVKVWRIKFAVKTEGLEKSRIYRKWILKTTKVRSIFTNEKEVGGIISIPNIKGMVNNFLEDVYGYDEHDVDVIGIITNEGDNYLQINEERLAAAIKQKTITNDKDIKFQLNSSTGYLAIADKVLYYTMINHVKSEVFRLIRFIDHFNKDSPDKIEVIAANTDGITVYAHKDLEIIIKSFIKHRVNVGTVFTFNVKKIYTEAEAHFTPNDVKMVN